MTETLTTVTDVQDRLAGNRFAMIATGDEKGSLSSRPVTLQEFVDTGDLWFLVDANADWVRPLNGEAVNASFVDDKTWVSFSGRAELNSSEAAVERLESPMTESFFADGATPAALRIATDQIEWWTAPNKAAQLIDMAKAKLADSPPNMGESGDIKL